VKTREQLKKPSHVNNRKLKKKTRNKETERNSRAKRKVRWPGEGKAIHNDPFWLPYITLRVHPCKPPSAAAACAAANQFGSTGGPPFDELAAAIAFRSTPWNTFSHAMVLPEWYPTPSAALINNNGSDLVAIVVEGGGADKFPLPFLLS